MKSIKIFFSIFLMILIGMTMTACQPPTMVIPTTLRITFNSFPTEYVLGPEYVRFSGNVYYEGNIEPRVDLYYSDRTTIFLCNLPIVKGHIWTYTENIIKGRWELVAKVTTADGQVAWSETRVLKIAPTARYAFVAPNSLYNDESDSWKIDQDVGTDAVSVVVHADTIIKYDTTGKISKKPLVGGSWTVDGTVKTKIRSMNVYDWIAYGWFADGRQYTKNLLINNSPWILIDDVLETKFSSVACDNLNAYGITLTGEFWMRDLTIVNSPWVRKIYYGVFHDEIVENVTAINVTPSSISVYASDTGYTYVTEKRTLGWWGRNIYPPISGAISFSTN